MNRAAAARLLLPRHRLYRTASRAPSYTSSPLKHTQLPAVPQQTGDNCAGTSSTSSLFFSPTMPFPIPYAKVNRAVYRPGKHVSPALQLTEQERKIRDLIVLYCQHYNATHPPSASSTQPAEPLVARITGGWVRDKLLGQQSHDIDIATNTLTGLDFAEGITEYIQTHADLLATKGLALEPRSIHKIERNPEKSKHLETATTKLYDLYIDVVNLRSEEYAADSRIPTMIFGTAEQDALRRDATVNALFYNLQEDQVEDLTGRGLQDLQDGVIRTPLPPFETFNDDPLRVLRLIRFASTFGFEVAPETLAAMSDPRIKEALMLKISRERVGLELTKALTSSRPQVCLLLLHYLGLHDAVFYLPEIYHIQPFDLPPDNMEVAVETANQVLQSTHPYLASQAAYPTTTTSPSESPDASDVKRLHFWLAVALNHLEGVLGALEKPREQPLTALVTARIIRVGIKLSSNDADTVTRFQMFHAADLSVALCPLDFARAASRRGLGLLVRKCGQHWGLFFLYCLFKDLVASKTAAAASGTTPQQPSEAQIYDFYNTLVTRIRGELALDDAWQLRPILNGKEVQAVFGAKKAGPWLTEALAALVELQLDDPTLTKDAAQAFLAANKERLLAAAPEPAPKPSKKKNSKVQN